MAARAADVPSHSFFSGNDDYDSCRRDWPLARSYVEGRFDEAAHAASVIDVTRHFAKDLPKNDVEVDFDMRRVVSYCAPARLDLEQVTDVFCDHLKDSPATRDSFPRSSSPGGKPIHSSNQIIENRSAGHRALWPPMPSAIVSACFAVSVAARLKFLVQTGTRRPIQWQNAYAERLIASANRTNLTEALRYHSLKASALYPAGG